MSRGLYYKTLQIRKIRIRNYGKKIRKKIKIRSYELLPKQYYKWFVATEIFFTEKMDAL